jgi:hypothetical protein
MERRNKIFGALSIMDRGKSKANRFRGKWFSFCVMLFAVGAVLYLLVPQQGNSAYDREKTCVEVCEDERESNLRDCEAMYLPGRERALCIQKTIEDFRDCVQGCR